MGANVHADDVDEVTRMSKRLKKAKQHAWQRWKEYIHGLLESQHVNRKQCTVPQIGDILLVIGEEKNSGEWKRDRVARHTKGRDGVVRGVVLLQYTRDIQSNVHFS